MCNCDQSKNNLLADKLRFHHAEVQRLLAELNSRGFTVYANRGGPWDQFVVNPCELTKITKIEQISL